MTEAEIEKQADIYANEKVAEIRTGKNSYNTLQMWCDRASGFVDGAKWGMEHAIEWHDLRKDPNDLPKDCEKVMFVTKGEKETLTGTFKNGGEGTIIFDTFGIAYYDVEQVIAWCELPQFKE